MTAPTCRGYSRALASAEPDRRAVAWCREQQREALRHLGPHVCADPNCYPHGVRLGLEDAVAEELIEMYPEKVTTTL